MRKGCKALLCLAAAVLGMFLVRLAVEKTEPSYPEALGNTLDVEKITGTCLVKEAAELPDTLTIFGSSELKTFEIPTHPANFFAGKRAGFQVNLVGRGSCGAGLRPINAQYTGMFCSCHVWLTAVRIA